MKNARLYISALSLIVLGACASQQIYYRQGATTAAIQRTQDQCLLQAQDRAPIDRKTRMIPGRFIPERQVCNAKGECVIRPAYQSFPEFETYDANADRRAILARTCMAERGLDRVSLPYCDASVKNAVPVAVTRTLPRLTETSCIIPRGNGAYQIVSQ